jgi:predicted RecA/RadA family phage recombinase
MPVDKPKAGETEEQYLKYCIPEEIKSGKAQDVAAAICYATYRKEVGMSGERLVASKINQLNKYKGINLKEEGDPCWSDYEQYGTKILDGVEVPNCIPIKD